MSSWITIDNRFKEGLAILNKVDNGKLKLLVNRIYQSLPLSVDTKIFSNEEEEKLSNSLNLKKDDVDLLLNTIITIYTKAAFSLVKPTVMETTMKESFNIEENKIIILSQAWAMHAKGIIDVFRQQSIFPSQVTDINWNLNIQASSSTIAKEAQSTVQLQLDLNDSTKSKLTVEMSKQELLEFYHVMEEIQAQIDLLK